VVRCFKNIPFTLAYRHQALQASLICTLPGAPTKSFLNNDKIKHGVTTTLNNITYAVLFEKFFNGLNINEIKIMCTPEIIYHGTSYKKKSVILLKCEDQYFPHFGIIDEIYVIDKIVYILFHATEIIHFSKTLNAYEINDIFPFQVDLLKITDLLFPHPYSYMVIQNMWYCLVIREQNLWVK